VKSANKRARRVSRHSRASAAAIRQIKPLMAAWIASSRTAQSIGYLFEQRGVRLTALPHIRRSRPASDALGLCALGAYR
jgi:hypothetical protein